MVAQNYRPFVVDLTQIGIPLHADKLSIHDEDSSHSHSRTNTFSSCRNF